MSKNDFTQILDRLETIQKELEDLELLIKDTLTTEEKPDLDNRSLPLDVSDRIAVELLSLPKIITFTQEEINEEARNVQQAWVDDNKS